MPDDPIEESYAHFMARQSDLHSGQAGTALIGDSSLHYSSHREALTTHIPGDPYVLVGDINRLSGLDIVSSLG